MIIYQCILLMNMVKNKGIIRYCVGIAKRQKDFYLRCHYICNSWSFNCCSFILYMIYKQFQDIYSKLTFLAFGKKLQNINITRHNNATND